MYLWSLCLALPGLTGALPSLVEPSTFGAKLILHLPGLQLPGPWKFSRYTKRVGLKTLGKFGKTRLFFMILKSSLIFVTLTISIFQHFSAVTLGSCIVSALPCWWWRAFGKYELLMPCCCHLARLKAWFHV